MFSKTWSFSIITFAVDDIAFYNTGEIYYK